MKRKRGKGLGGTTCMIFTLILVAWSISVPSAGSDDQLTGRNRLSAELGWEATTEIEDLNRWGWAAWLLCLIKFLAFSPGIAEVASR